MGRLLPDLVFEDSNGATLRLRDVLPASGALVIALRDPHGADRGLGADLRRAGSELEGERVAWLLLSAHPDPDPAFVAAELEALPGAVFVPDPGPELLAALRADRAGLCWVVDSARTLRYRGAVDDRRGPGGENAPPAREFLRDALEQVLAGQAVRVAATAAPGRELPLPELAARDAAEPTYHGSIARILQAHCASCHREGGAGPFVLDDYESAYDRRRMIANVVSAGIMPPWHARPGEIEFLNDASLPPEDREALARWVEAGAPEGDPSEAPLPLRWLSEWTVGEPDEVFQLDRERAIPAEGVIEWDPIPADRTATRDMWVQGIEVLPGDPTVVHHCNVFFRPPAASGVKTPGWQRLVGYLPGKEPVRFQRGLAQFVPQGSELVFEMHYTPNGRATTDRTRLGLILADGPPRFMPNALIARQYDIEIPPESTAEFTAELVVREDTALFSVGPHMHLRGRRVTVDLFPPEGGELRLLDAAWDPDWQFTYLLKEPLELRAGTRVVVHGEFDNTSANPANPDPSERVVDGPQSWNEMLLIALGTIQPRQDPVVYRGGWGEIPTMQGGTWTGRADAARARGEPVPEVNDGEAGSR